MMLLLLSLLFAVSSSASGFLWNGNYTRERTHTSITRNGTKLAVQVYWFKTYRNKLDVDCLHKHAPYIEARNHFVAGNADTDLDPVSYWQSWAHFDSEQFAAAQQWILDHRKSSKENIAEGNMSGAAWDLGHAMHTLQDFYSHSNWIELGMTKPSPGTLGNTKLRFGVQLAGPKDRTCVSCANATGYCYKNTVGKKLTTAYHKGEKNTTGQLMSKKKIKCSHGGSGDGFAYEQPLGGISKDYRGSSPHGYLQDKAALVAEHATKELLLDIWREIKDDAKFEALMGITDLKKICKRPGARGTTKKPKPTKPKANAWTKPQPAGPQKPTVQKGGNQGGKNDGGKDGGGTVGTGGKGAKGGGKGRKPTRGPTGGRPNRAARYSVASEDF